MKIRVCSLLLLTLASGAIAQVSPKLQAKLEQQARQLEPSVITWRRHLHQYPELSNREVKTAAYVAEHLRKLGLEVQTGIAHTGVVALLRTGKPGPVIALRADMDALPVTERNSLPFASKEKTTFNDQETGVMHACGHDSHVAILMAVAEILSKNKNDLKGTIKFIFQPAEEGPPKGEEGGADLMVREGVLDNPKVEVIFGLHIQGIRKLGQIAYKPAGMMAASDWFTIKVKGKQSHGAAPWLGIDPIVVSAQIINGIQTIVSRQTQLTKEPAVISVGMINAGVRQNIIPETAEMSGTIRTFDPAMQQDIHERLKRTATLIAESAGATAEVTIDRKTPVTFNDPALTEKMVASLVKAAGEENVARIPADTGAEDFAYYQQKVPGFFFFVGACPPDTDPAKAPSHHTPDFMMDERGMLTGLKAMLNVTVDYMYNKTE
ncbi:amidohydrolase [Fulvivirgaceae bacterium QH1ED-6-2]|nr:amidohydrolase [Parachryseolinea silvisoli]MCD9016824.1 amidohydrolase [Parachryseolinea silvisoli]